MATRFARRNSNKERALLWGGACLLVYTSALGQAGRPRQNPSTSQKNEGSHEKAVNSAFPSAVGFECQRRSERATDHHRKALLQSAAVTPKVMIAGAVGIAATCRWCLETDKPRAQRAERNRTREMRGLADKILTVHKRYPTGDVVVSEPDLAEQLRKRRDAVAKALNILLGERKVQKAPLNGYWKLRSRPTPLRMYSWPASRTLNVTHNAPPVIELVA
jgi:hypothetical protein